MLLRKFKINPSDYERDKLGKLIDYSRVTYNILLDIWNNMEDPDPDKVNDQFLYNMEEWEEQYPISILETRLLELIIDWREFNEGIVGHKPTYKSEKEMTEKCCYIINDELYPIKLWNGYLYVEEERFQLDKDFKLSTGFIQAIMLTEEQGDYWVTVYLRLPYYINPV